MAWITMAAKAARNLLPILAAEIGSHYLFNDMTSSEQKQLTDQTPAELQELLLASEPTKLANVLQKLGGPEATYELVVNAAHSLANSPSIRERLIALANSISQKFYQPQFVADHSLPLGSVSSDTLLLEDQRDPPLLLPIIGSVNPVDESAFASMIQIAEDLTTVQALGIDLPKLQSLSRLLTVANMDGGARLIEQAARVRRGVAYDY